MIMPVTAGIMYNRGVSGSSTMLKRWGYATILMVVIFIFSSIPNSVMPKFGLMDILVKKGGHALGFGLLALAYLYGLSGNFRERKLRMTLTALVLATLYAALDEYHQSFVPGRHPSIVDILIDMCGSSLALLAARSNFWKT
jgi:VanZ family protein